MEANPQSFKGSTAEHRSVSRDRVTTKKTRTLSSLTPDFNKRTVAAGKKKLLGLPSGFTQLDSVMLGIRGTFVLSGPPGSGKSTLELQISDHVVRNSKSNVVFCSVEMNTDAVLGHLASLATGLSRQEVHRGLHRSADVSEKWDDYVRTYGRRFAILDDRDFSVKRMAEAVEDISSPGAPALVVIDSLHQAAHAVRGKRDSERDALDSVLRQLRAESEVAGFSLIVSAHVSKSRAKSDALFTSGGSATIDFTADTSAVLLPCEPQGTKSSCVETHLTLVKNRFGPTGKCCLVHYPERSLFEEETK